MVLDEISRLSGKLNQLLQFSRPTVRGSEVAAAGDAASVLREVIGVLRPEADRRGIALSLDAPAQPIAVAVSAEALNDIFSNIVVNALEAVASGGSVASSLAIADDACVVTVEDDGPGIPASSREKILQPFFTTKSQGTGLGLAIVARRVAECGGKLFWKSPVANGRGTRFAITLPRSEERR
jgi:signal transduction histidine kinase